MDQMQTFAVEPADGFHGGFGLGVAGVQRGRVKPDFVEIIARLKTIAL